VIAPPPPPPPPPPPAPCRCSLLLAPAAALAVATAAQGQSGHTIAVGQSIQGSLTTADHLRRRDSTYSQSWTLSGTAGRTVTVDLESTDFDPYLFIAGPGIPTSIQDDDAGGNCNARVTLTFAQTGDYVIVVNSATRNGTGAFNLRVTSGAKPASLIRCGRDH
jgi:hypothetical protein